MSRSRPVWFPRPWRRGATPHTTTASPSLALSIYDPVHFGIDENGEDVRVELIDRNLLIGGEPGAGKSSLLNTVVAHAA